VLLIQIWKRLESKVLRRCPKEQFHWELVHA